MLGRLKMSIKDCIKAYLELSVQAFSKRNLLTRALKGELSPLDPHFDTNKLTAAIKSVVSSEDGASLLQAEESDSTCKVYVVCLNLGYHKSRLVTINLPPDLLWLIKKTQAGRRVYALITT